MEEIKVDLNVLKFLFNILRNQVLLEKEIPKDVFFQAQEYILSHNDTLKHTNIYKSYITYQSSWKQKPQIIKSIQLLTNENVDSSVLPTQSGVIELRGLNYN